MRTSTMQEHRQYIAAIEREIATLTAERGSILALDRPLRAGEVDRVYDINHEIEWCFERMAMHLPLLEEKATADRWDPLTPKVIDAMFAPSAERA